jgi:hypothetical protein
MSYLGEWADFHSSADTNYKTTTQSTIITERHCRIWRLITKGDQPSDWVHNMVKADKSLRICLDKKHKHKNILRICSDKYEDKYEVMSALTAYKSSNSSGLDKPPAQMNHDRATKTKIPVTTQNLLPIWKGGLEIRTQFLQNQVTSKRYYCQVHIEDGGAKT